MAVPALEAKLVEKPLIVLDLNILNLKGGFFVRIKSNAINFLYLLNNTLQKLAFRFWKMAKNRVNRGRPERNNKTDFEELKSYAQRVEFQAQMTSFLMVYTKVMTNNTELSP